jgi:predicted metal-dependent hydrolase
MEAPLERSEVQYGRTRIPYAIRRSGRRGTVALAVEPTGEVLLTAPVAVPVERLDRVVHQKARWIVEHWRRSKAVGREQVTRDFVSGESFYYLGRQYRLRVRRGGAEVRLHRGWLDVSIAAQDDQPTVVRGLLVDWYKAQASRRLPERVAYWAKKLDVDVAKVLVRDQQKRWASCDPAATLRFNWRVVQATAALADYVVAHELVHILHRHHGAAFWRVLGRVMPDYEKRREQLRRWGASTVW